MAGEGGSLALSITFTLGIEPRMRSTKTSVLFCLVVLAWWSMLSMTSLGHRNVTAVLLELSVMSDGELG